MTEMISSLSLVCEMKYGNPDQMGWSPLQRRKYNYHTPDDYYEAKLLSVIKPDTNWLDVGCGRDIFPSNIPLAKTLSERCSLLVGLDPGDNIDLNPFVHEKHKCFIEDFKTDHRFDVISLRMVAEHIAKPEAAVSALGQLIKPGGIVIIYTVNKRSPSSLIAAMTPMAVHHTVKRLLWDGREEDTFPTTYLMNTRYELKTLFEHHGFFEHDFVYLDDCRSFQKWPLTSLTELIIWKALSSLGLCYPENCLLGTYTMPVTT